MKQLETLFQQKWIGWLLFSIFWIVIGVIYYPAHKALLIDDGISGLWEMKQEGLKGFLSSYGFKSFYYGHYIIIGFIYLVFGTNQLGWFLVFTAIHALNSTLIFTVFKKIYQQYVQGSQSSWIALFGALLFLLSPYQSENIIWGATSHYFSTLCILLIGMNWLVDYIVADKRNFSIYLFHGLFAFSLITLEISFLFPVVFILLFIMLIVTRKSAISIPNYLLAILLPQIILVGVYICFYRLKNGSWIPHDRSQMDAVVTMPYMITTLSQHLMKLIGQIHLFDLKTREWVYGLAIHWKRMLILWGVLIVAISGWCYYKEKSKLIGVYFLLLGSLLMFAPFVRVYFMYFNQVENNRYSYFASVFMMQLIVFILFLFNKWLRGILLVSLLGLYVFFIFPSMEARKYSSKLYTTYLNKFPDTIKGKIYLMNVPAYCNNAYMFRAKYRLPISIQAIYNKNVFNQLVQIAWYNSVTDQDSFAVKTLSDSSYEMVLKTNGAWWMYESNGAADYENDDYKFDVGEWGNYTLTFKHPLRKEDALLYFNGKRFVKVN
jgi:hypothetical protein